MGSTHSQLPDLTYCEVSKHQYWLFCKSFVYDVETFVNCHPGGPNCLINAHNLGRSISKDIDFHRSKGKTMIDSKIIGKICKCTNNFCKFCHKI